MMDENQTKVFTILLEISDKIGTIRSDIGKIEGDLKEHIRRTAVAESRLDKVDEKLSTLQKSYYMVQGAITLVSIIGVLAAIYAHLS